MSISFHTVIKKIMFSCPPTRFLFLSPRNSDVSAVAFPHLFFVLVECYMRCCLSLFVLQNARPLHPRTPPRPDYRYWDTRFHDGIHGNDTSSPKGGRRPPVTLHRFAGGLNAPPLIMYPRLSLSHSLS
jgi:hypothetical protein